MSTSGQKTTVGDVSSFWNVAPCGTHLVRDYTDRKDFYRKYSGFRYRSEWHIPQLVPFQDGRGKQVLEVGCGNGADGIQWALHGASYTGVDLSETAVAATREHFQIADLKGRFQTENAEQLSFPDDSFDIVYSHGVLHHTPNTQCAINELRRVLKPSGKAIVMLYHKHSFNYYVRILLYMRLRLVLQIIRRCGHWTVDKEKILNGRSSDTSTSDIWETHYKNFLVTGWRYLARDVFINHATDGPECPLARVYTKADALKLFSTFTEVKFKVAHLPLTQILGRSHISQWLERFLAPNFGFYLFIYARR